MNLSKVSSLIMLFLLISCGSAFAAGSLFGAAQTYNVGSYPRGIAAVDIDNDTTLDLIVANISSNNISVMIGNGDGSFGGAVPHAITAGQFPKAVQIGDMNKDGDLDIVTGGFNGIDILFGSGIGTFGSLTNIDVGAVEYIALGDFDGDTWTDIATTRTTWDSVSIHMNNGDNTFTTVNEPTADGSVAILAGTLDNNASIDLVVSCNTGELWKLINDGSGVFTSSVFQIDTNFNTSYIALADFNGNGRLDLAVTNSFTDSLTIYNNGGTGDFVAYYNYLVGSNSIALIADNFDADSIPDVIISDRTAEHIRFLHGNGDLSFALDSVYVPGGRAAELAVGDFDEDGYNDVAVSCDDSGWVAVFLNRTSFLLDVDDDQTGTVLPDRFVLGQNYPNPFNPSTSIEFSLPSRSWVTIDVYNIVGQKVFNLANGDYAAGSHRVEWNGTTKSGSLAGTGIYFYRFEAEGNVETKRMLLLK